MSRLQTYLTNEEYFSRIEDWGQSFEVFVNPSRKEMNEFKKEGIRFIANLKKKKLYIWDGWSGALHNEAWQQINRGSSLGNNIMVGNAVAGVATFYKGEWIVNNADGESYTLSYFDDLKVRDVDNYLKKIKWLDKYFDFTDYTKVFLKQYGKI